jgi:hypothetical protein
VSGLVPFDCSSLALGSGPRLFVIILSSCPAAVSGSSDCSSLLGSQSAKGQGPRQRRQWGGQPEQPELSARKAGREGQRGRRCEPGCRERRVEAGTERKEVKEAGAENSQELARGGGRRFVRARRRARLCCRRLLASRPERRDSLASERERGRARERELSGSGETERECVHESEPLAQGLGRAAPEPRAQ